MGSFSFWQGCAPAAVRALAWTLSRIPPDDPVHQATIIVRCDRAYDRDLDFDKNHGTVQASTELGALVITVHTDCDPARLAATLIHELAHVSLGHVDVDRAREARARLEALAAAGEPVPAPSKARMREFAEAAEQAQSGSLYQKVASWGFQFHEDPDGRYRVVGFVG
jgi:hypothetical protein